PSYYWFKDVVDFTVGWYVEPDQPKNVIDKCNQILTDLRSLWFDALPAAVTLMKRFVDDANAYLESRKPASKLYPLSETPNALKAYGSPSFKTTAPRSEVLNLAMSLVPIIKGSLLADYYQHQIGTSCGCGAAVQATPVEL
uniref:DUF4953 domain-containing protein n=1 Tax=Ascaris lumbricoides TaxID=6252 RepID=A0A0M3IP08_ASCLU